VDDHVLGDRVRGQHLVDLLDLPPQRGLGGRRVAGPLDGGAPEHVVGVDQAGVLGRRVDEVRLVVAERGRRVAPLAFRPLDGPVRALEVARVVHAGQPAGVERRVGRRPGQELALGPDDLGAGAHQALVGL